MDGEHEASEQMTDEVYANDSNESERHRLIIGSEQLDIEAYAGLYSGRTKIARLLYIADRCDNVSMQLEALRLAFDLIKKGEDTHLFGEIDSSFLLSLQF